jgi:hypothetical protein
VNALNTFRRKVRDEFPAVRVSTKMVTLPECRRLSAPLLSVTGASERELLVINGWAVIAGIIPDRTKS